MTLILSILIVGMALMACRSSAWRPASLFVIGNEIIELIGYDYLFNWSQIDQTEWYMYYAGKDCLLIMLFFVFCVPKKPPFGFDPIMVLSSAFGAMVVLNLIVHTSIQISYYNFVWEYYVNIYNVLQVWLIGCLMFGAQEEEHERGLYE